jgi:uncharacterized DUF497 family protein
LPALLASGFNWDARNLEKCQKHGVSIAEIEAVLRADLQIAPAPRQSLAEERLSNRADTKWAGSVRRLHLARPKWAPLVGPISARYMHAKEIERYEATRS